MTLTADLLHATVAREVGYHDAFAFSVAFKRAHSISVARNSPAREIEAPSTLPSDDGFLTGL